MANWPKVSLNFVRQLHGFQRHKNLKSWKKDSVKHALVTFYPRSPNYEEPKITPTKLLMVHKVKPLKGNPWWEQETLTELGLEERGSKPIIVKNTPEVCKRLWSVKHLIKVTPIRLPDKLPDANDLDGCYLHENGTFHVIPKVDPQRIAVTQTYQESSKKFDCKTIMEQLRLKWLNGGVH